MTTHGIPSRGSDAGPEPETLDTYDCIGAATQALAMAWENSSDEKRCRLWLDEAEKWINNAKERIGK